jgi:hypothetical protein
MPSTHWFEVQPGATFALALVNTGASGYASTWQTPNGSAVSAVAVSAYGMPGGTSWQCQLLSGKITPSKNTTRRSRPATWCDDASETSTPVSSSYTADLTIAQDPDVAQGLQAFLYEYDAQEAYIYIGLDDTPPRAAGRVYLHAADWGGAPDEDLTADLSFDFKDRPDIQFGDATTSRIVAG